MSARKQKTGTNIPDSPASTLKNKPLEEGINKEKLKKFKELLLKKDGFEQLVEIVTNSPEDIFIVSQMLGDKDLTLRCHVVQVLDSASKKGADISIAIPALMKALQYDDGDVKIFVTMCLNSAIENEASKVATLKALVKSLEGNNGHLKEDSLFILRDAAENCVDIAITIPALVKLLGEKEQIIQKISTMILNDNLEIHQELRITVSKAILDFTNSHEFMIGAEKNSDYYLRSIQAFDQLLSKIKASESTPQEAQP